MALRFYILENRKPRRVTTEEWAMWFGSHTAERIVARWDFGDTSVSTVFIGFEQGFPLDDDDDAPPRLFETMVFGGDHNGHKELHATWEAAEARHQTLCKYIRRLARQRHAT